MIGSQRNPHATSCLACLHEIGLFRRLAHHRFCCEQHESTYLAELERIAIERLHSARISASSGCQHVEIDNSYVAGHQAVTPMPGDEQTLALLGNPNAGGFGHSSAYRAAT
jgi:hypothetical protein